MFIVRIGIVIGVLSLSFVYVVVQLLQVCLAAFKVLPRAFSCVKFYFRRRIIVDQLVVFGHHTESVGHGKEGEVGCMWVQHVFAENHFAVIYAELTEQCGCDILL